MSAPTVPAAPRLSIILPAFNEEALLVTTVEQLIASLATLGIPTEIVLVNDGSTDATPTLADQLAARLDPVRAVHQANQGIGGAFRHGARLATGEYLMLWPADMPATAEDLVPYIRALGSADVIVGRRRGRAGYNPLMLFNAWLYPKLVSCLFGLALHDVNWIHAYRREKFLAINLTQTGIPMLAEILVRLRDAGATFREIDVVMKPRAGGQASAGRLRVMWRTLTGLFTLWLDWRRTRP